jgi:hypothetical protein
VKKNILIRGVDVGVYRSAKAAASLRGITLGEAVNQALSEWVKRVEQLTLEREVEQNLEFTRSSWDDLIKYKGKIVVVAQQKLQGVFEHFEEARRVASNFRVVAHLPRRPETHGEDHRAWPRNGSTMRHSHLQHP